MFKKIVYALVVAVLLLPVTFVRAAYNDVIAGDATVTIVLPSNGLSYSIGTNLAVESFTVNNSSIDFVMPSGSKARITSSDKSVFSFSGGYSKCTTAQITCDSSQSVVDIACDNETSQTVTITLESGTCVVQGSGGSSSGGGGWYYTAPPTPAPTIAPSPAPTTAPVPATTPAPVTTPAPAASPAIIPSPVISAYTPSVVSAPQFEQSSPDSLVQFSNVAATSFQPGERLKYLYQYENTEETVAKVKIIRQLINSKGKIVSQSTGSATLKPGALFIKNVSEVVNKKLPAGEYTVKVKTVDVKTNKMLDENSFGIEIEKLKKQIFTLGEVSVLDSAIVFDAKTLAKIKSNVAMPTGLKLKYSYINNTDAKQQVKMTRELVDEDGKVVASVKPGNWSLKPGKKYTVSVTQSSLNNLPAGNYTIRIRAYDKKTGELLAENELGFAVELR